MASKKRGMRKGNQSLPFFGPVIEALKELGGSGRPSEVKDLVFHNMKISEEEQNELLPSGTPRLSYQIDWARQFLVKWGYIDSSKWGVWNLTEKGQNATMTEQDALAIYQEIQEQESIPDKEIKPKDKKGKIENEEISTETGDYRNPLMNILKNLPPNGFERLCQRLLREAGFQKVVVTGRTGDGGIDGNGILQVNPFVSFQVLFQSKRYSGSVTASQIRDFRGAMMGRTDKGVFITTGTFTAGAKGEASRVPPLIELVDGEKLLDMFEDLGLGLKPKKAYEVDRDFFEEFSK